MSLLEKQTVKRSYQSTMNDVRSELSPLEQSWSKIIHNPVLSQIGTSLTITILRPRPLITGAVIAIVFILAAYLLERLYGYQVSGSESLLGFSIGWAAGAIYSLVIELLSRLRLR